MPERNGTGLTGRYRGRFAPSPTGPLHEGSVVAALASYLDARANRGEWLVRMEDLDPPRESPEAATAILKALEALGLHWDGAVVYQSTRHAAYTDALAYLASHELTFHCSCTRQQLSGTAGLYPGTCRLLDLPAGTDTAVRCKVDPVSISFTDGFQGPVSQNLAAEIGDFIIKRRDGLHAYQLAVVVDDAWQEITHVVRGIDLLDSTPRQIHLQRLLGYPTPAYSHIPVVVNAEGQKLSKQNKAEPVDTSRAQAVLVKALQHLQQAPPAELVEADTDTVLGWAIEHWTPENLQGIRQIAARCTTAV